MDADGRKLHGEPTAQLYPPLGRFHELGDVGVTRVECREGVHNAYDRPRESIFAVAERLDKGLAEEQSKVRVAIAGKALSHALQGLNRTGEIVVVEMVWYGVLRRFRVAG